MHVSAAGKLQGSLHIYTEQNKKNSFKQSRFSAVAAFRATPVFISVGRNISFCGSTPKVLEAVEAQMLPTRCQKCSGRRMAHNCANAIQTWKAPCVVMIDTTSVPAPRIHSCMSGFCCYQRGRCTLALLSSFLCCLDDTYDMVAATVCPD